MSLETFLAAAASPRAAEQTNSVAEGRVNGVTSRGLTFTVPGWDGGRHVFGPAPWPQSRTEAVSHSHQVTVTTVDGTASGTASAVEHAHVPTTPSPGDRCLVLFVGSGVENPWVLGWWSA